MKHRMLYGLLCLVVACTGKVLAEEESRDPQAAAIYQDYGNVTRDISIALSSTNIVLISSSPEDAVSINTGTVDLGIMQWRHREIVNCSTTSALRLYWTSEYNSYSSTGGVVLSSSSSGNGLGDSYAVVGGGQIWGIHSPWDTACDNCAGICGTESYWSLAEDRKRRR